MLSLIRFLSRNIFFIQFLLLEIFCFYLIVQNSYYQKANVVSSSNRITGSVYDSYNGLVEYFSLAETNETLARENADFRNNSMDAFVKVFGKTAVINDTSYRQIYSYTTAKVINKSTNKRNNYFTIDKGMLQGIEPQMAVVCGNGVVGIVKNTSPHFSTIMTVLHKDVNISAKIKKNNYFGFITWDGSDYRIGQLQDIPVHVQLQPGDTIVTTGFSAIFPENVPIGIIRDFEPPKGKNFYKINVQFLADFQQVNYVYVIKNLYRNEQIELEQTTEIQ